GHPGEAAERGAVLPGCDRAVRGQPGVRDRVEGGGDLAALATGAADDTLGVPVALALGLRGGLAASLLQVADIVRLGLLAVVLGVDSDDADSNADSEGGRGGEGGQPGLPLGGS